MVARYVIACMCNPTNVPLAYLDDDRPSALTLTGAPQATKQIYIGHVLADGSTADQYVKDGWAARQFTDNGTSWVIRCNVGTCTEQAQLSTETLPKVAELLAVQARIQPGVLPVVAFDDALRHLVPLRELHRHLAHHMG